MKITQELDLLKNNYNKTIDIVDGLPFSQKETIKTIEFYSHSKYKNGQKDELGRDKPFYQILNAICDVENTAKDLDTKDIQVVSDDNNHYVTSYLLSKDIQVWMKDADFAKTLNDMRDIHTRYGSLLVKKVMKEEKGKRVLRLEMPEWKNVITDQVDIINSPIIETHWLTISDFVKKNEWNNTKEIIQVMRKEGTTKRIPVYEIRGNFSQAVFKDANNEKVSDKDYDEYSYQLYYVAGLPEEIGKTKSDGIKYYVLYSEDNTEEVYKYLARKPKDGRAFGFGVFEEGEEAQIWTNDAIMKQYRAMEYTTKVIGQTSSKKLKGRNLLTETDDGTILETEDNKPITALNLLPSGGLAQYNNLITQWYDQLEKTTSAYAAQRGDTPPSGTPFRLQASVLQQSSSVFKTLQQEMGIFITEIFEDWIMPYLASNLNKAHILAFDFSPEELKSIDKSFSVEWANQQAVNKVLAGKIISQDEYDTWMKNADQFIKMTKSRRFIDIPKDFYKNLEAKVTVNVTGEQRNKAATLESLNNILITYASNPNLSSDPVASQLLARIIELSGAGISPTSITGAISEKNKQEQAMQAQNMQAQPQTVSPQKQTLTANPTPA